MSAAPRGLRFEAIGLPGAQGSKRHVGRGVMVESSKKVGPWREAVANAARAAHCGHPPLDGPLSLEVVFRLPATSLADETTSEASSTPTARS